LSIRKLRAGRVPGVYANNWVGEVGTLFYDETTGQFKIADGVTPGGHFVSLVVASNTQVGGIKAGPGANVGSDGTLTINTAGLPLSIADFSFVNGNLSVVNTNENMNLITNGTGNVNIIGNLQLFSTGSGYVYPTNPIFNVLNSGNVNVNGNLLTNGNTTATGTFTFNGPAIHYGNLTINGNTVNNGSTINNGLLTQNGNLRAVGQSTHIVANISTITAAGFLITGNVQGLAQAPQNVGVGLHISGYDDGSTPSRLYVDSIGQYAVIAGRRFNGNIGTPTQVLANQDIIRWGGTPYSSSGWPTIGPARMAFTASENISSTNQGGRVEFWATPNGTVASTNIQRVLTVDADVGITSNLNITAVGNITAYGVSTTDGISVGGNVSVANDVYAQNYYIASNGIRNLGANTSPTINFGTDSLVLIYNPGGTVTFSLTNFVAGASVKALVALTANRTINFGVANAMHSTTGATSVTYGGPGNPGVPETLSLEYICVDGTLANTYVIATYL
jgi:hypothetical protein